MHPVRKKRLTLLMIMLSGVAVAICLILYALKDNINYFFPPGDIEAGKAPIDKRIRVGGMVVPGSIKRNNDDLSVSFVLTDYKGKLNVTYKGILPDLFAENEGAVAAGKLQANGTFMADEVLAKHDENYMPPEVAETLHKKPESSADKYTQ